MANGTAEETQAQGQNPTPAQKAAAAEEWKKYVDLSPVDLPKTNKTARDEAMNRLAEMGISPQSTNPDTELERMRREQEKDLGIGAGPEDRIRRELSALDVYARSYALRAEQEVGNIAPEGVVLKDTYKEIKATPDGKWENTDAWEKPFEWKKADVEAIIDRFTQIGETYGQLKMTNNEIKNALEILLASGKTTKQILDKLNNSQERWAHTLANIQQRGGVQGDIVLTFFSDLREDHRIPNEALDSFGIDQEDLMHNMFHDHFKGENERDYQGSQPRNVEELAWQIEYSEPGLFGLNGDFPVLEMRIMTNPKTGKREGDWYINEGNMVRWLRERMWTLYDIQRDDKLDFFGSVTIDKTFGPITLGQIFQRPGRYFKSKHHNYSGEQLNYERVSFQWIVEGWSMGLMRSMDVDYKRAPMGEPKPLIDTIKKIFYDSHLTKETFGSNIYNMLMVQPLNYRSPKKGETWVGDNVMGSAMNDIYLSYDALSDYQTLQQIWGPQSLAFTRDGFLSAMGDVKSANLEVTRVVNPKAILGHKASDLFDKAFDKEGKVSGPKNIEAYLKLVNFYLDETVDGNLERVVRTLFTFAAEQKYGQKLKEKDGKTIKTDKLGIPQYGLLADNGSHDTWTARLAEVAAYSQTRFSGAGAINDPGAVGYDYATRWFLTQSYRTKMPARGDFFGNPLSVYQFKGMAVDLYRGLNTTYEITDEHGKVRREQTVIEVMKDLNASNNLYLSKIKPLEQKLDDIKGTTPEKARLEAQIQELKRKMNIDWQDIAGRLNFKREAMQVYAKNHLERAQRLYDMIIHGKDIGFEKYTHFDTFRGVTFKRDEFAEDIQNGLFKQARYLLSNYPDLNFNMKMRMLNQTKTKKNHGNPVYEEMYLGERLFGHAMVNRKEFWKMEGGRYIKDGAGRHVIDWEKVQRLIKDEKTRPMLWKQFVMTKIASELRAHRSIHTTDPSYNVGYYLNILDALASIPGEIHGDEFSTDVRTPRNSFFSKADMAWIKRYAGVTNFRLYTVAFLTDHFHKKPGEQGALSAFIGLAFKHSLLPG